MKQLISVVDYRIFNLTKLFETFMMTEMMYDKEFYNPHESCGGKF